jgi:pyridoxal 5'-phosphate synthase pdxT subunit
VRVGVLAIQGDFAAHAQAIRRAGHDARLVRQPGDLDALDALVLPGGESTAMLRGIARDGLDTPLRTFLTSGRPVLGTCAGSILLARHVTGPCQQSYGALDIDVARNAYGTQIDSFAAPVDAGSVFPNLEAVFIRAPRIVRVGPAVDILARVHGDPVLVRCGAVWASTFHPELTEDDRLLRTWLQNGRGGMFAAPVAPADSNAAS